MLDKRLLILKRCIEEEKYDFESLSSAMRVSTRQLSLLLKNWADSDFINYTPGSGRNIQMNITIRIDIDKLLLTEFMKYRNDMAISEIEEYLNLPWHKDSIDKIQKLILKDIMSIEPAIYDSVMLDFMFSIPDSVMPNEVNEFFAVHMLRQVSDTLYRIKPDGEIDYELLAYDEWHGNDLHLFLKKNIYFSDGTVLTAGIVKQSLDRLRKSGLYTDYFNNIAEIIIYDDYHLSLTVTKHRHIIKYQLTQPVTAIYIPIDDVIFAGTGPYRISSKTDDMITLKANLNSFRPLPDIRKVYLMKNQTKIKQYYTKNFSDTYNFKTYMASNFILFNPLTDRFLLSERQFLMWVIKDAVYDGYKGKYKTSFEVSEVVRPKNIIYDSIHKKGPIKALVTNRSKPQFDFAKERLKEFNIEMEYIYLTDDEYLNKDISVYDADVVIMQENYSRIQPLKLIDLLTHCKFKEWYLKIDDFFTFRYKEEEIEGDFTTAKLSESLLNDLETESRIEYLYDLYRMVTLPSGYKIDHKTEESIIKYSKIIKDYEL